MHSRIFQIEKEALTKEDYINSGSIPAWFTDSIADSISDACNREEDIDWLMTAALDGIATVDGNKLNFSSDVRRFFKENHKAFIEAAEELSGTTLEDFVSSFSVYSTLFHLNEAYSNRYGFYVYHDDGILDTLDNFVRHVKDGVTYYIGGVVDYHF